MIMYSRPNVLNFTYWREETVSPYVYRLTIGEAVLIVHKFLKVEFMNEVNRPVRPVETTIHCVAHTPDLLDEYLRLWNRGDFET